MKSQSKHKKIPLTLLLLAMLVLAPAAMAASISTDLEDYAPWEIVTIKGSGFEPNSVITVAITGPNDWGVDEFDSTIYPEEWVIWRFDDSGGFTCAYAKVKVDGLYTVTATDGINTATTTFTDAEVISVEVVAGSDNAVILVEQGKAVSFNIKLSAPTGNLDPSYTSTNPATAQIPTVYSVLSGGSTSASQPSSVYQFWWTPTYNPQGRATPGPATWTGYPTPYSVSAIASAALDAPTADYTITIVPTLSNPGGAPRLVNDTSDTLTIRVVAAPGPPPDTTPPGVVSIGVSKSVINEADDGKSFCVSVTFNEEMDILVAPTITFTPDVTTTTLEFKEGGWSMSNKLYTATYDVYDADVEIVPTDTVDVTVSGAQDVAGNPMAETLEEDLFAIDTIAPEVTATPDRSANANEWYNDDVTVTFSAIDGWGIESIDEPVILTTEGEDQVIEGSATDLAGNVGTGSITLNIDKTKPVITAGIPTGTPGNNPWWISDVTVPFSATDNLSGFAPDGALSTTMASKTTSGEGSALTVTSDGISDMAGNAATGVQAGPYKVDKTPPVITAGTPIGDAGSNDWWVSDVTVPFSATDSLSGFAPDGALSATMASKTTSGEGSALTVTSDGISDMAGNAATGVQAGPYKVDKTPPVITAGTRTGTPGNNGWWISDVTVPFSATDNLSGFAPGGALSATMASKTTSGEGSALTVTSDGISDMAGNAATGVQAGPYKVDKTAPVVTITVPTEGAEYLLNQNVSANWSATDALSGIASASGTVASGSPIPTGTVGANTFTVTATDKAGNTTTKTVNYYVRYNFIGFFPPVDNPPFINVGKAGRTFPIKWQLKDANGNFISSLSVVLYDPLRYRQTISGSTTLEDLIPGDTSGASGLRYDSTANQYIFTWQTSSTFVNKSYELLLELNDGSVHKALFKFTK